MQADSSADLPMIVLEEPDTLEWLLELVETLVRSHPAAAQAIATALVAEGRRFARIPEGRQWRSALADSELVRRGRMLWYMSGFDDLVSESQEPDAVLSDWLALVADALMRTNLEALLSRRLRREDTNGAARRAQPARWPAGA
jgi:hypothetical protein